MKNRVIPNAFTINERDRRWGLARQIMQANDLEVLMVYGDRESAAPAPFCIDHYFTNDRLGSVVLFHLDKAPVVVTFASMMVADHMQAAMRGDMQWIAPEQIVVGKTGHNIAQVLIDLGVSSRANIGVIGLEPYPPFYFDGAMPFNTLTGIKKRLPNVNFVPVYKQFFQLASVKSEEELEHIKHAAMIGEAMSEAMRATAIPGNTEADIAAAVTSTCLSMGGFTAEILMGSGPEYIGWGQPAWQYRSQKPREIQEGDIVLTEIFALYGMYETQHQAAVAVGKVHPNIEKAAEISRECYEIGVEYLKEGVTFGEVVDKMEQPLLRSKGWHVHPLIHSINPYGPIGFGTAPGIESLPIAQKYRQLERLPNPGRELVLKAGMTFAFEPNCAFGYHLCNLGGTVVVGKEKGIELNKNSTYLMRADI
ncbi:M24 family metallopeptidase [Providencia stuartii]|uniref:Peptidase n=1 Tax=Providencia stuartii (strain MRSN 2154) TaxID=1157951 RepID=A0A140NSS4_PROSM|nr:MULTISPECIES: M24 family metallopeptidase [Providencia]AFH95971.1 peptidase [Providencia stuartii MRSN 2154]MDE8744741.1 M24 family metallopeptidase [Providencia thailandensis]MDE8765960.1 M24 family metallopeptidase [Providencia thailandensis]MDE8778305.1 M24 family metallopeptidase [Providencia thailandensis]MDE8782561.1 M24 family metallopeptidase [Providencia thailandensis]